MVTRAKTAVLYSAGIDSTVLAHQIAASGDLNCLIMFNYGREGHVKLYKDYGSPLARKLEVPLYTSRFSYRALLMRDGQPDHSLFQFRYQPKNQFTREQLSTDIGPLAEDVDFGWLDGRNPLMMLQAAIAARYSGCDRLLVGTQIESYELEINQVPLPPQACDTVKQMIDTMNLVVYQSFQHPFMIAAPFLAFTKRQVMLLGKKLEVDFNNTHSCEYIPACGKCSQCMQVATLRTELGV